MMSSEVDQQEELKLQVTGAEQAAGVQSSGALN